MCNVKRKTVVTKTGNTECCRCRATPRTKEWAGHARPTALFTRKTTQCQGNITWILTPDILFNHIEILCHLLWVYVRTYLTIG